MCVCSVSPLGHSIAPDSLQGAIASGLLGGGSVANLLAVWRVHGLDEILRHNAEHGALGPGRVDVPVVGAVGADEAGGVADLDGVAERLFRHRNSRKTGV